MTNDPIAQTAAESDLGTMFSNLAVNVEIAADGEVVQAAFTERVDLACFANDLAAQAMGKYTATFEREVNTNGVPVRRLVLRGDWEVDNAALTAAGAAR